MGDDLQSVATNRAVIADIAGVPADSVIMMRQCHSAKVAVVRDTSVGEIMGVDASSPACPTWCWWHWPPTAFRSS